MNNFNNADYICSQIPMRDLAERYGIEVNNKNFCCCPFHNEKTPSMRIYEHTFYCFGCGAKRSPIDFIMKIEQVDFKTACKRLDEIYNLGIYSQPTLAKTARMERYKRKIVNNKKLANECKEKYWKAFEEWKKYDDCINNCKPKAGEEPSKEFLESLANIEQATYKLSLLEVEKGW